MDLETLRLAKNYVNKQILQASGHTHSNKVTLDKFSEGTSGLEFNGVPVNQEVSSLSSDFSTFKNSAALQLAETLFYEEITYEKLHDNISGTDYILTYVPNKDKTGALIKLKHGYQNDQMNHALGGETARSFSGRYMASLTVNASTWATTIENNITVKRIQGIQIQDGNINQIGSGGTSYTLGIKADNTLKSYPPSTTAAAILQDGCVDAITGYFPMIENGVAVDPTIYNLNENATQPNPRNVIAQMSNKDLIFLTCEGRTATDVGMTYADVIRILAAKGVQIAYCLDGGGSTQTVVRGVLLNPPIDDNGKTERAVQDFLYIDRSVTNEGYLRTVIKDIGNMNKNLSDVARDLYNVTDTDYMTLYADVDSTNYKANQKVGIDYLRSVQAKKYAAVMRKLRTGNPVKFTHKGDDLTYGYDIYSNDIRSADPTLCPDGSKHTTTRASKTYPEAFAEYLNTVYGAGKITSINHGYSGDYASAALNRWYKKHTGDLSLFMIGMNDSRKPECPYVGNVEEYLYWMEQLIIRELLWGKAVVLLTPLKIQVATDLNVDTFGHALYLLGQKYNIPVIDTQEMIANYSYDIYSDGSHLNGTGYRVLGAKIASAFVGEGAAKPFEVSSGSTLLMRPMLDNIHYINGASFNTIATTGTPDETLEGKGIYCSIEPGGSIIYSFYNSIDNLIVIPSFYMFANAKAKLTVDFGVKQPQRSLDSTYFQSKNQHEDMPYYVEYSANSSAIEFDKSYLLRNKLDPLFVLSKGWHTIKVEATADKVYWYGLEFMNFQELYNVKNIGTVKEVVLFEGSATTGTVTLLDDITRFKYVMIQTGSTSGTPMTLTTMPCRSFSNQNFQLTTGYLRVQTASGYFLAQITGTNQITIQNASDALRGIYGIDEYKL